MFRLPARLLVPLLPIGAAILLVASSRPPDIPFRVRMIDPGFNETVAVADLNNDGRPDIISGENWYEAPNWIKHPLRADRLQLQLHRQLHRYRPRRGWRRLD